VLKIGLRVMGMAREGEMGGVIMGWARREKRKGRGEMNVPGIPD